MTDAGAYDILSHIPLPECSIRIIRMAAQEHVAPHLHERSVQVYTVLENVVEARVGDQVIRLRPYETVRIDKQVVHSVRAVEGAALVLSLSIPPLQPDDQQIITSQAVIES